MPDRVSAILKQKGGAVWSIAPKSTVYDALVLMADKEIGALLVMDGGRVAGVMSERDYARKIILKARSSKETRVDEIMMSPPITISTDCTVSEAMRIMTEHRIRHLPVVDSGAAVLGMISIGDLVKWIITSQEETIEHLHSYIAGKT
ncbi:MAG TPA: CBS domain-containing protein [Bryobacteraceae bacterium]|nr:CBS domain-containing protein [Bryobacteraceae bacterium]